MTPWVEWKSATDDDGVVHAVKKLDRSDAHALGFDPPWHDRTYYARCDEERYFHEYHRDRVTCVMCLEAGG